MAKIQTPRPIRGTQDMLGETADRFTHVVETFERVRKLYGFKRIETPVFEATSVFSRSLGETTDVVSKEMYTFEDRGGDSLTLRPEFTAGIARAYITEGWQQYAPLKVATHGPLFRYERPQKGRYRQFHQVDAEILGAAEPLADIELLIFADQLVKELGIADKVTINLNTLGDAATRDAWRAALLEHFASHRDQLSEDSLRRLEANPLRILDSKDPQDRPIADSAPEIDEFLTAEAADFFAAVKAGLDAAGVAYVRDTRLVRGLDYYRHTAFELISTHLGAQAAAGGGGRYDGLIEALGGPPTPAVGWALGIDRLAMLIDTPDTRLDAVLAVEDDAALPAAIQALGALRQAGLSADVVASGSPRKRYDKAAKIPARALVSVRMENDKPSFNVRGDSPEQIKTVLGALAS
ncbi:MAG: histidine--tRNA ligase [Sphingomonadales bacterium]|nr:histidine--tRNA ligase [Sphingomonadales bacterium]